jgi:hypothetical protein
MGQKNSRTASHYSDTGPIPALIVFLFRYWTKQMPEGRSFC